MVKQVVEAEIITFAFDRLSLVISQSTRCCSDVETEALLRRGLPQLGINVGVARRTRDLGVDTGGGSRRAVGVVRKRLCKAAKRSRRLAVIRRHTKKASALHSTNIWPFSSFGAAGTGIAPSTMQGIRSRAAEAVCPKSGWCVTSCIAIGLPHNADPAVQGGIECVKRWLVFWHDADEFVRMRVRRAWKLSLGQLRDGSSRWTKVRGPMRAFLCVLFDAGWFPLHPTNWKQAGCEGDYWSFTGVGDSAALIHVLLWDILSVHWAGAATHWDGAGLERGCDVSIIKQHLCVFENHAVHGALLTAATGACWPKARVAGLLHVELDESCVRCKAVRDAIQRDHVRKSQHLFQRAKRAREYELLFSGPEAWSQPSGWRCLLRGRPSNHA